MLCIRTENPVSELYLYKEGIKIGEIKWEAHRTLAVTILDKIERLLALQGETLQSIKRVGVYEGPGSFTGLRIGVSTANALGYSLCVPVVQATGDDWVQKCLTTRAGKFITASPKYGQEPHITTQKK
jgi:tRNA threonylcarbamoyladenosine biosynthesis protein TsaB